MLAPIPGAYIVVKHQVDAKPAKQILCTCGARAFAASNGTSDDKSTSRKIQPVSADGSSATTTTTASDSIDPSKTTSSLQSSSSTSAQPQPRKRSLWRKLLGKGPKCVCRQQQQPEPEPEPELLKIPSEYVGCKHVLVAGKRVAFTREMQQKLRKSWDPLEAIDED